MKIENIKKSVNFSVLCLVLLFRFVERNPQVSPLMNPKTGSSKQKFLKSDYLLGIPLATTSI